MKKKDTVHLRYQNIGFCEVADQSNIKLLENGSIDCSPYLLGAQQNLYGRLLAAKVAPKTDPKIYVQN